MPPLLLLEVWSAQNKQQPGIFKFLSSVNVSELRYVSERQIISKLWTKTQVVRREIFVKIQAKILFKFQQQIEKLGPQIGFEPGFVSILPLNNIKNGIDQVAKPCYIITYQKDTNTLRIQKESINNNFLSEKRLLIV